MAVYKMAMVDEDQTVDFPLWLYHKIGLGKVNGYTMYHIKDEVKKIAPEGWPKLIMVKSFRRPKSTGARERFMKELRLKYVLRHPGLLTCYGICPDGLITETIPPRLDETLKKEKERGGRLTVKQVAILSAQILGALEYLHENAVVHGNLKPENVFLAILEKRPGVVSLQIKLADCGIPTSYTEEEEVEEYSHDGWDDWSCEADVRSAGEIIERLLGQSELPNVFDSFLSLFLEEDSRKRLSAAQLLDHPFIRMHNDPERIGDISYDKATVMQKADKEDALLMAASSFMSPSMDRFKDYDVEKGSNSSPVNKLRRFLGINRNKMEVSKKFTLDPSTLEFGSSLVIKKG